MCLKHAQVGAANFLHVSATWFALDGTDLAWNFFLEKPDTLTPVVIPCCSP